MSGSCRFHYFLGGVSAVVDAVEDRLLPADHRQTSSTPNRSRRLSVDPILTKVAVVVVVVVWQKRRHWWVRLLSLRRRSHDVDLGQRGFDTLPKSPGDKQERGGRQVV